MSDQKTLLLKIQADVSDLKKSQAQIRRELDQTGKKSSETGEKIEKSFKKGAKSARQFGESLLSVKGIIAGAIVKGTLDMVVAQRKLEQQTRALRSNAAFGGLQKDFENIEASTQGMINQFEIVGAVNKALAFGIDLSGGKLNDLVKMAQKASIAMGTDLKTAVDDMITAMGRGSVMIADNLGATFKLSEAYDAYAKKLNTTAAALTDHQKKLAFNEMFLKRLETAYKHIGEDQLYDPIIANAKRIEGAWNDVRGGLSWLVGKIVEGTQEVGIGIAKITHPMEALKNEMFEQRQQAEKLAEKHRQMRKFLLDHNEEVFLAVVNTQKYTEKINFLNKAYKQQVTLEKQLAKIRLSEAQRLAKFTASLDEDPGQKEYLAWLKKRGEELDKLDEKDKKTEERQKKAAARRSEQIREIQAEIDMRRAVGMLDKETEIKLKGKLDLLKAITAEERVRARLLVEQDLAQLQLTENLKKGLSEATASITDQLTESVNSFLNWEGVEQTDGEWSIFEPFVTGAENMATSVGMSFDSMMTDATESADEARATFMAISNTGLGLIKQMATESADAVLLSIADMAAGFAWSAGSQMVADGIAQNAKAAIVSTWPFVGPALAAPMFATANSAIAGGLGLMAAGGIGSFFTAQGMDTSGGGSSAGAQERNAEAEQQETTIFVQSTLYPDKTTFQKEFKRNGVQIKT